MTASGGRRGILSLCMPIRAILFDLGDTIFRLDPIGPAVEDDLARLLREHASLPPGTAAAIAASLSDRVRTYANGLSDGSELREIDIAREASNLIRAARATVPGPTAEAIAQLFSEADIARFRPALDCASRVEAFRRAGFRLAIVSNTSSSPALMSAYLASAGLHDLFDAIVFSSALGWRKPDPRVYHAALGGLGVAAGEALFVGDRVLQDVTGRQAIGIPAVLTHEFRQEPPGQSRPVAIIERLEDLHTVVAR